MKKLFAKAWLLLLGGVFSAWFLRLLYEAVREEPWAMAIVFGVLGVVAVTYWAAGELFD
jgi:hypothetical protein